MSPSEVRPIIRRLVNPSAEEVERAVQVMLDALEGDTSLEALTWGDRFVESLIYRLTIRKAASEGGECYVAQEGDKFLGVSVWLPPGLDWRYCDDPEYTQHLKEGLKEWYTTHYIPKYNDLYRSGFREGVEYRKNAWKMKLIGVVPSARRKGLGRKLLDIACEMVDQRNEVAVADAKDPYTVHFFQGSGFKHSSVKNMMCTAYPGFPIWCMVREVSSKSGSQSAPAIQQQH